MMAKKAAEHTGNLSAFLERYNYQPELTPRLGEIADRGEDFSQRIIDEIVLWKLNRYVEVPSEVLAALNSVQTLGPSQHREAREALERLLGIHGCDLAMASTFLRFRNPSVFQIIDRHAYRAVYGTKFPLYPSSSAARKISTYFDYLDELRKISEIRSIDFRLLDQLLYVFDKEVNGKL